MADIQSTVIPARVNNLIGKRFGRLVVESFAGILSSGTYWNCLCDCGNRKKIRSNNLTCGLTVACGCLMTHRTHGGTGSPEHAAWNAMIQRCSNERNKHYKDYGGRGITVCNRWRSSFADFLADMGPRPSADHSIDRFPNNDGNYEPGNCRWATRFEQHANKRSNHYIDFAGQRLMVSEWAKRLGCTPGTISKRLKSGWCVERAVTILPRKMRHR